MGGIKKSGSTSEVSKNVDEVFMTYKSICSDIKDIQKSINDVLVAFIKLDKQISMYDLGKFDIDRKMRLNDMKRDVSVASSKLGNIVRFGATVAVSHHNEIKRSIGDTLF